MTRLMTPRSRFGICVLSPSTLGCSGNSNTPKAAEHPFKGHDRRRGDRRPRHPPALVAQRGEWSANRGPRSRYATKPVDPRAEGVDVFLFPANASASWSMADCWPTCPKRSHDRHPPGVEPAEGASPGTEAADPLQLSDLVPPIASK